MNNCFVLIVEESIKNFSVVGSGVNCKFTFAVKGQTSPFEGLQVGDHVIGYISNEIKKFAYLFEVDSVLSESECVLKKTFETVNGLDFDDAPEDIRTAIHDHEQTTSFIQVAPDSYSEMVRLMLGSCSSAELGVLAIKENLVDETTRISGGSNILLYGVPGSGKSWTIEHEYCHEKSVVERLVFHPDYTNADFIGQILPIVDDEKQVTYEFTPGPFTTIMRDAYTHPTREYILIIEEVNRGNAPAIFGEVFQLLDRMVEPKTAEGVTYSIGTSEYGITHKYMAETIYGDSTQKVRIPSNLSIVGTMNTSDQNVFTLDTAFQRRWRMRLIENNFDNVRASLADAEILDTKVSWKRFCENINGLVVGNKSKMASAEDKRLGVYFIHEKDIAFDDRAIPSANYSGIYAELKALEKLERNETIDSTQKARLVDIREALMQNRIFPEKVIKYLWDDAFKFSPELLFDTDKYDCLEDIIAAFVYSSGNDRFDIFRSTMRGHFYPATDSAQAD